MFLKSALEKFDIICFYPLEFLGWVDASVTNFTCYVFFSLFLIALFLYINMYNTILPVVNRVFLIKVFEFVFELVEKQIGPKGFIFYPFFLLLFLFILISNLLGLIPFSFSPTAHLVFTLFFSIIVWCTAIALGILENGLNFYKIFVPDAPAFLIPLLVVIEVLSYFIRVISLALRLAANITAGHVLMFTIAGFAVKLLDFNFFVFLLALVALSLIFLLELGVAFLQAYVFVTLACIYLNDSLNMSH